MSLHQEEESKNPVPMLLLSALASSKRIRFEHDAQKSRNKLGGNDKTSKPSPERLGQLLQGCQLQSIICTVNEMDTAKVTNEANEGMEELEAAA